nr:phage tail spike protein [Thalassobacillus sp. CUG 92003]
MKSGEVLDVLSNKKENSFWGDSHERALKNNSEIFRFNTLPNARATAHLHKRNRLLIPDEDNRLREFIIRNVKQNRKERQVYSVASFTELKRGKPIMRGTYSGATLNSMMDEALHGSRWERGYTEFAGTQAFVIDEVITPYDLLRKIASEFDRELKFYIEVDEANNITARKVDAIEKMEEWRGREISSCKDLINAEWEETTVDVATALYGVGPEKEDGTRIIVEVVDEAARQVWGVDGEHLWDIHVIETEDQEMSEEDVRLYTKQELNKRIAAKVQYRISGADLEYVLGRSHQKIRIGDRLWIKATEYNPALYLDARVIKVESPITDRSKKIYTLGEFIEYSEESIAKLRKELRKRINQKSSYFIDDTPPLDKSRVWVDISDPDNPKWKVWSPEQLDWIEGPNGPQGPQGVQGPPGEDGETYYTWIKYADDVDGNGMSDVPTGKAYLGISYENTSPTESSDPADYEWSKIKGDQGVEGPPGEDGTTHYTWIKYADAEDGTGISDDPTNKPYLGVSYDNLSQTESSDPADYTWSKILGPEGPQGPQGLQGEQGPKGNQGIQGEPGKDGVSSYTHIAYANSSDGSEGFSVSDSTGKTHIGMYVDSNATDSSDPADYAWSKIKGAKGDQGIQGPEGEDGQTPYFHTAWADSADGYTNFSTTTAANRDYIGTYTDFTQSDSNNPDDYKWSKIKGEKGDTGDQGPEGPTGPEGDQGPQGPKGESARFAIMFEDSSEINNWDADSGNSISASSDAYSFGRAALITSNSSTAASSGDGSTVHRVIPEELALLFAENKIKISAYIKQPSSNAAGEVGFAYSTYDVGNSGWSKFTPPASWEKVSFEYDVPSPDDGETDFLIVWGDTSGGGGSTLVDNISIEIVGPKGDEGPQGPEGPEGPQGIRGPSGEDGEPRYIWIKYADDSSGNGMSDTPTGKNYIGIAHNRTSSSESSDPNDYEWSKYEGPTGPQGPEGDRGPQGEQGPQGPNIVDSTTEIEANVITSNHLSVSNLSAISSSLGTVTAGSITSNTSIDVNTDVYVGRNIYMEKSDDVTGIEFEDGQGSFAGRVMKSQNKYGLTLQASTSGLTLDADVIFFGRSGEIQFEDGHTFANDITAEDAIFNKVTTDTFYAQFVRVTQDETGLCGLGATNPFDSRDNNIGGYSVQFQNKKDYTPSSISLSERSAYAADPYVADITKAGFWFYIKNSLTSKNYKYWRGNYTA